MRKTSTVRGLSFESTELLPFTLLLLLSRFTSGEFSTFVHTSNMVEFSKPIILWTFFLAALCQEFAFSGSSNEGKLPISLSCL
jgi:hypothetical protein